MKSPHFPILIQRTENGGIFLRWLWYFIIYSFAGFLLEVSFAHLIGHPKRDRKCFLLLPLCPVYGLGALLILWAARPELGALWVAAAGALAATAAELLMGLFYRFAIGVEFWDYAGLPGNVAGLVCPQFAAAWGLLALALVYRVHPLLAALTAELPARAAPPAAILLAADGAVSAAALRRTGTTEVLRWYAP